MNRLSILLIAAVSTSASGQTAIEGRHDNPSELFDIAEHNPIACDDETLAAATSWRDANVTFAPFFNAC